MALARTNARRVIGSEVLVAEFVDVKQKHNSPLDFADKVGRYCTKKGVVALITLAKATAIAVRECVTFIICSNSELALVNAFGVQVRQPDPVANGLV